MIKFSWHENAVPDNVQIKQVYGVIFTKDGRTLMKVDNVKSGRYYTLAGGTVETYDKSMADTLKREMLEEINTTLDDPIYLGYQLVENDGNKPPYAQVRMTAMIKDIGPRRPDLDNNELYERFLTPPENAKKLLKWGAIGDKIIDCAVKVAKENFDIEFNNKTSQFLND